MKTLTTLIVIAVLAAACGGASEEAPRVEGTWRLESGTLDGVPIPMFATHPITLVMEDVRISGTAACNSYQGRADVSGNAFAVAGMAVTEMACVPLEVMDSEQAFLAALGDANSAEVTDGRLILRGPRSELVFVSADQGPAG